jgi:hypothetical protein
MNPLIIFFNISVIVATMRPRARGRLDKSNAELGRVFTSHRSGFGD